MCLSIYKKNLNNWRACTTKKRKRKKKKHLLREIIGLLEALHVGQVSCTAYATESRNHCQSCETRTCTTETNPVTVVVTS